MVPGKAEGRECRRNRRLRRLVFFIESTLSSVAEVAKTLGFRCIFSCDAESLRDFRYDQVRYEKVSCYREVGNRRLAGLRRSRSVSRSFRDSSRLRCFVFRRVGFGWTAIEFRRCGALLHRPNPRPELTSVQTWTVVTW